MRPHPRIRKTVKWAGAAVTVLLVVVWIGSGWWDVGYGSSEARFSVGIGFGAFRVSHTLGSGALDYGDGVTAERTTEPFEWWFGGDNTGRYQGVSLPLWVPALLLAIAVWRLDTLARLRAKLNLCPKCNYDRAGLAVGAACPECGLKPAESAVHA